MVDGRMQNLRMLLQPPNSLLRAFKDASHPTHRKVRFGCPELLGSFVIPVAERTNRSQLKGKT
jgi:hypothetical protein